MIIKLNKPFASNGGADEFDVRQMKKALNKLGYYTPLKETGITDTPDRTVFGALKQFQTDQNLTPTGTARPGDATVTALNSEVAKSQNGKYVWRTVGDDRVRSSHAALDGETRDWDDSPDPGEEVNCRCWAEPVSCDEEFIKQRVITEINDADQWTWVDYSMHYWFRDGIPVTLEEIGYLASVIDFSKATIFPNISKQVSDLAREIEQGELYYTTKRGYEFRDVSYPLGGAVIATETKGTVQINGKCLIIDAEVTYDFKDTFTDILSIRQKVLKEIGTSDPKHPAFDENRWTEFGGTFFDISGAWSTKMTGIIKCKRN